MEGEKVWREDTGHKWPSPDYFQHSVSGRLFNCCFFGPVLTRALSDTNMDTVKWALGLITISVGMCWISSPFSRTTIAVNFKLWLRSGTKWYCHHYNCLWLLNSFIHDMLHFFVMLLSLLFLVVSGSPGFHWTWRKVQCRPKTHMLTFSLWCHEALTSKNKCQSAVTSDRKWKWN